MGTVPTSEISKSIYDSTHHHIPVDRFYMKMYGEVHIEIYSSLILALEMPQLLTPVPTGLGVR